MTRTIEKGDIRVGDTIRITREVEVKQVYTYGIQNTNGRVHAIDDTDKPVIELLKRPLPPLPTKIGSMIEVGGERWFLQEENGLTPRRWINGYGSFPWPESMKSHAQEKGGFEVIV